MRTFLFSLKISISLQINSSVSKWQNNRHKAQRWKFICSCKEKFSAFFSDMGVITTVSVHVVMAITPVVSQFESY